MTGYNPFIVPFFWLAGTAFVAVLIAISSERPGYRAAALAVIFGNAIVGLHLYAILATP